MDGDEEESALVRRVRGTDDRRVPVKDVVVRPRSRAARRRRVFLEVLEFTRRGVRGRTRERWDRSARGDARGRAKTEGGWRRRNRRRFSLSSRSARRSLRRAIDARAREKTYGRGGDDATFAHLQLLANAFGRHRGVGFLRVSCACRASRACAGVCAGDARVRRSSSCSYRAGDAT